MIRWAKKVTKEKIAELYSSDAAGYNDIELVDEVGTALYARCESIISVTYGFEKKLLICPLCGKEIPLDTEKNEFSCECGFHATWQEFRASYKGKQLYGANALPAFLEYHRNFPNAHSYKKKMMCIDRLIHAFHVLHSYRSESVSYDPYDKNNTLGRPVCTNLIEGSLSEVVKFLDTLSESNAKAEWKAIIHRANGGNSI